MRRSLARFPSPAIGRASAAFSTSFPGGAGGGGRGRGGRINFTVENPPRNESEDDSRLEDAPPPPPHGRGRGRGQAVQSSPCGLPSFTAFLNNDPNAPPIGRGRGFVPAKTISPPLRDESGSTSPPKRGVKNPFPSVMGEDGQFDLSESKFASKPGEVLPTEISSALSGVGRGKPFPVSPTPSEKPKSENRHIRPPRQEAKSQDTTPSSSPREKLSPEERVKKAVEILGRKDAERGRGTDAVGGGRGGRGGRDREGWRGRGRGRVSVVGRGRGERRYEESDEDLGGPEDEEKLAKKLGPKVMNELAEGIDEMSSRVLPSPVDEAYLDALHTTFLVMQFWLCFLLNLVN